MESKPRRRWEFRPGESEDGGVLVLFPPLCTRAVQGDPTESQGGRPRPPAGGAGHHPGASAPRPACPGPGGNPAARPSALECGPPFCLFLRGRAAGVYLLQFGTLGPELLKTKTQKGGGEDHGD